MKNAISVTAVKTFDAVVESPPVQKTTIRISGAKIAVRLKTRAIEGFGISRPPRLRGRPRRGASPRASSRDRLFDLDLLAFLGLDHVLVLVALELLAAASLLTAGHGPIMPWAPRPDDLGDVVAPRW